MPPMKTPGPDHPITLHAAAGRLQASYQGHVIADSANVLMLQEADYPAVAYFPRGDVDMAYLARTARTSHCPYKGEASYYTLNMDGKLAENAVWSYEQPYPAMTPIEGRLAFYPQVVSVEPLRGEAAEVATDEVAQVVRHTDEGDGASQAQPWPPSVTAPRP